MSIEVASVRRAYGRTMAVEDASLRLEPGRIACLLGPSGCGKSTLLRLIAGLDTVDAGEISADGQLLSGRRAHVRPERRNIGLVFQDYALFPHLSVLDNVAFGLNRKKKDERRRIATEKLELVRMADRARAWPHQLSGGEQQRVALARALAPGPRAILLDEPFSGLDGRLKAQVRDAALAALREAGAAALIVTHDAEEAMLMGDEIVLMHSGRTLQAGAPRDVYLRPASPTAARLLGEANVLEVTLKNGRTETPFGRVFAAGRNGPAQLLVRPEGVLFDGEGAPAQVTAAAFMGGSARLTLSAGDQFLTARAPSVSAPQPGETVKVRLDPAYCVVFPSKAGAQQPR
ncbi:MAG TPA: ABC transporter ATP-binding protein [Caulobacteraceae bacterium]